APRSAHRRGAVAREEEPVVAPERELVGREARRRLVALPRRADRLDLTARAVDADPGAAERRDLDLAAGRAAGHDDGERRPRVERLGEEVAEPPEPVEDVARPGEDHAAERMARPRRGDRGCDALSRDGAHGGPERLGLAVVHDDVVEVAAP